MPTKVFTELDSDKRKRIEEAAMEEFAAYGYENSSTNRIVKECGISKGSLFKYFESKMELYFYLTDMVTAEMMRDMSGLALPADIFARIEAYAAAEMSWYIDHPAEGRFIIAAAQTRGEMGVKLAERYGSQGDAIYEALLGGADMDIHHDRRCAADVIKWVLAGFKEQFLDTMHGSTEELKEEYTARLSVYLDILRSGI